MFKLALRSLFAKKVRLVGTALSVTLGIAFLTGTLLFTDTMGRTYDNLFADIYEDTDSYVRSSTSVELEMGVTQRGRIPEATIETVRGVRGVGQAEGLVQGFAQIIGADGDPVGNMGMGPPTFGSNYLSGTLGPWVLTEGSRAPGPGELVIDKASAEEGNLRIGDEVTVLTQTGPRQFPLVGTVRFGSIDSPAGASVSLFDLRTAQDVLVGRPGEIDAVVVDAKLGVSEEELTERIAAVLPEGQEALTGSEITAEQQDLIADALSFFDSLLLVFALVGLVVASFTIFNTFQIIITQRIREMALLRAVGARRSQVLAAQLVEAIVIGLLASVAGLALGFLVAVLLKGALVAFGIDVPTGGTVILPRTVIAALVVGTVVTVVSAVFPALRASRIPPMAALRKVSLDRTGQTWHRLAFGAAVSVLGVAAFVAGLAGGTPMWVGVGVFLTFVGVFVLGPLLARPFAGAVGAPLPAVSGITGELARENAMRNPKRTARTGGALMVGVALVVSIGVLAASAKDWIRDVFAEGFTGDYVVSTASFGFGGLSPQVAAELNELPEVATATGVRVGVARVTQERQTDAEYIAVDPATASQMFDIGMVEGRLEGLDDSGVLLDDGEARARQIGVGDVLQFQFLNGDVHQLTVEGIYTEQDLAGDFVITQALHETSGSDQFDFSVYVEVAPGVSDQEARAAIDGVASAYPNADVQSRAEYLDAQAAQLDPIVNLMYALLTLAIIIALFSIANSMALSIHERTHEFGLLRAVGMTRRQTRSAVRWESVLVALLGTGFGVLLGIFFGWSISVTIRDEGLDTATLPIRSIVIVALLAVCGALLAASRPAHRAARMNVLQAIAAE